MGMISLFIVVFLTAIQWAWADEGGGPNRDRIHANGVGAVVLGKPLPKEALTPDLRERYVAGYHSDAQPYEGFRLVKPPVLAVLDDGPFTRKARKALVDPAKVKLSASAVSAVKKGAKIKAILVEDVRVRTEAGIGVGSNLAVLEAAYPGIRLLTTPPTFGEDECVARPEALATAHFYFRDCKTAREDGRVVRVILYRE